MITNTAGAIVLLQEGVDYRGIWHNTSPRFAAKNYSGEIIKNESGPGYWNPMPVFAIIPETSGSIELWGAQHQADIIVETVYKPVGIESGNLELYKRYYYTVTAQDSNGFWSWPPPQVIGSATPDKRSLKIGFKTSALPSALRLLRSTRADVYEEFIDIPITDNYIIDDGNLSFTPITNPTPPTKSNMEFGGYTTVNSGALVPGTIYPIYLYKYYGSGTFYGLVSTVYPYDSKKY